MNYHDILLHFKIPFLRSYSMFQFENQNGRLKNYITGYRKVAAQIISRCTIYFHIRKQGIRPKTNLKVFLETLGV